MFLPSPIQLTRVKDLAPGQNVDAVGLKDILGDPMIKECWNFNFLFDIDFVMLVQSFAIFCVNVVLTGSGSISIPILEIW